MRCSILFPSLNRWSIVAATTPLSSSSRPVVARSQHPRTDEQPHTTWPHARARRRAPVGVHRRQCNKSPPPPPCFEYTRRRSGRMRGPGPIGIFVPENPVGKVYRNPSAPRMSRGHVSLISNADGTRPFTRNIKFDEGKKSALYNLFSWFQRLFFFIFRHFFVFCYTFKYQTTAHKTHRRWYVSGIR